MIYADVALNAVLVAVIFDLYLLRSQMMTRMIFWKTYFLILPFQLLTNWWLTSNNIVMYSEGEIIGTRVAGAPLEDLLFGFALVLSVFIGIGMLLSIGIDKIVDRGLFTWLSRQAYILVFLVAVSVAFGMGLKSAVARRLG